MEREKRVQYFEKVYNKVKDNEYKTIEESLMEYIRLNLSGEQVTLNLINDKTIINIFSEEEFPIDIEFVVEFFEYLLDKEQKNENGIVFTPKYISDYIAQDCLKDIKKWSKSIKIIDPGCGCGIFLISAIEYLKHKFGVDLKSIIENNIYGIDIIPDNIRRCNYVLNLYTIMNGEEYKSLNTNLICKDSLDCEWAKEFHIKNFNYVIGNPPYVNPHDMKEETTKFIKEKYVTARDGVFNIFYAFIEEGLKNINNGNLEFIIPNNVLTIKSAYSLRELLQKGKYLDTIIDFSDNMIFKPVRTYNCIIKLNKNNNSKINYAIIKKDKNIENQLSNIKFYVIDNEHLDNNGWKLADDLTRNNITKIESQKIPIKDFIRTGIATLKDKVYMVNKDEKGYYKIVDGKRYDIESTLVKPIYKIPELKNCDDPNDAVQYIIFPYYNENGGYKLIKEEELKQKYPKTYDYLLQEKESLDERDKGKGNPYGWYAYGRTQGLNKYGKKMVFPTFASYPKFRLIQDENALFCNGYAVFENDQIPLEILEKILNSKVMHYYVSNTSYPIEGGYYCYQKKYIEKFSIPEFTESEINILKSANKEKVDEMLMKVYNIEIAEEN